MDITDQIVEKWEATGLLRESHDPVGLATCLEQQRIYNETHDLIDDYRMISIPLLRRLHETAECMRRNSFGHFYEAALPRTLVFAHRLKMNWAEGPGRLDAVTETCRVAAEKIGAEMDAAFRDRVDTDVHFGGLTCMDDGTVILLYA